MEIRSEGHLLMQRVRKTKEKLCLGCLYVPSHTYTDKYKSTYKIFVENSMFLSYITEGLLA